MSYIKFDPDKNFYFHQGMSERVKTSEEFENTRKNNAEFALANKMATSLYNFIYPNWRSMFRRFTIPYMTARLLEELKKEKDSDI